MTARFQFRTRHLFKLTLYFGFFCFVVRLAALNWMHLLIFLVSAGAPLVVLMLVVCLAIIPRRHGDAHSGNHSSGP